MLEDEPMTMPGEHPEGLPTKKPMPMSFEETWEQISPNIGVNMSVMFLERMKQACRLFYDAGEIRGIKETLANLKELAV